MKFYYDEHNMIVTNKMMFINYLDYKVGTRKITCEVGLNGRGIQPENV